MNLEAKIAPMLTIEDFAGREGTIWMVDATPEPLRIRLEAIYPGLAQASLSRFPFTLSFTTAWDEMLMDAIYQLQPVDGGEPVQIHLTQTQTPPGPRRFYHAEFN